MIFRKKQKIKKDIDINDTWSDTISKINIRIEEAEGTVSNNLSINKSLFSLVFIFTFLLMILLFKVFNLQVFSYAEYKEISENNIQIKQNVFADRGNILDRNGEKLAYNEYVEDLDYKKRSYAGEGFGSLLGFVSNPTKDKKGIYYKYYHTGDSGLEYFYNSELTGYNGSLVLERDALGNIIADRFLEKPINGSDVELYIDKDIQEAMYSAIKNTSNSLDFLAAAGILMDINTGEILSMVSYPDYDSNIFTTGTNEEKEKYLFDKRGIFTNRPLSGLYTPGSVVKPFFAIGALEEKIITPNTRIHSSGEISIPNPFVENEVSIFKDWKAHGWLDLRGALAWSSNVYFYYLGGGFEPKNFKGMGIDMLRFYGRLFGFEKKTNIGFAKEPAGLIPHPTWKVKTQNDIWRLGDTYNTVIGQYSFQVTPLQLVRAVAAIANDGILVEPVLRKGDFSKKTYLSIDKKNLDIVKKGMRDTLLDGTAGRLNIKEYNIAAKTGTAQVGNNDIYNSILIGFLPYEKPKYAFVFVMEKGTNGGAAVTAAIPFFKELYNIENS